MLDAFTSILLNLGFSKERAALCAELFAKSSLDGVPSHGLNRFPSFIEMVKEGHVSKDAEPALEEGFGFFERWDGNLGPGNLNAHFAMQRAMDLSREKGTGMVALRNTNHWMRAGNYGWQAVEQGCIGICFTNTTPNMPGWGGSEPRLGNNPLVIAVPRAKGPLVLDIAMSQFSYGKMLQYFKKGEQLPYDAGFDLDGETTKEPGVIIDRQLALPIGLWKGAGLSLLFDILAATLSGGKATHEIGKLEKEYAISQVFLCLYPPKLGMEGFSDDKIDAIIADFKSSPTFDSKEIRYPGENTLAVRKQNMESGVPVDADIWKGVLGLLNK